MNYRPQFAYTPAPEGWQDEEFEYVFDFSNMPAFQTVLAPGQEILGMVMELQRDAPFYWRAFQVSNPNSFLALRWKTPDGTYLQDDYAPMASFSGFPGAAGGIPGGAPVAFESEIACPPGAVLVLDALNMA